MANKIHSPIISIIIPVYNEEKCIYENITKINNYFSTLDESYEVIVSDDGSTDNTTNIIEQIDLPNLKIIRNVKNVGKGHAVNQGVRTAQGKYIFFTDADLSAPIDQFDKLFLYKEYDIVIGSRRMNSSQEETSFKKLILGRIASAFISLVAVKDITDTMCGFKLFKKSAARHLFSIQRLKRFGFDVEILYLTQRGKYSIKEVPIKWAISKDSTVNLANYFYSVIEVISIHIIHRQKKYKT